MTDNTTQAAAPLSVQATAVQRALAMLNAAGAAYAVQFDGQTYGTLEVKPQRTGKRQRKYPRGETRNHYLPYLTMLRPSDAVAVPYGQFDPATIAANISAYCVNNWGKGAAMTQRNDAAGTVEVLRLA